MSTEQVPIDPAHTQAYIEALRQLHSGKSGTTAGTTARITLTNAGMPERQAADIVHGLTTRIAEEKRKQANKDILRGALWCGGGLIVTMVTYSMASGGGSYVVAWGAIIFGAIQLIRGLVNHS